MGRLLVVVVALAGCRQLFGIDPTEVATGDASDVPADGEPVGVDGSGGDAATCFGSGVEVVCLAAAPSEPVVITGGTLDTDAASACSPVRSITTPACVVAGTSIDVAGVLRVTGSLPLVLVASGPIRVSGGIDVASRRSGGPGAGSGSAECMLGNDATVSGGGAGGSFGASGGDGGSGASGGMRGTAGPAASNLSLRGGCPGGPGGNSNDGEAGAGGGAVYLIATTQIRIEGVINASGAAGAGGLPSVRGGSGGGSGGFIGLDGPEVFVGLGGRVFANGGGGGEGAGTNSTGGTGEESTSPADRPTGGGDTNANAGDGGAGGYGTNGAVDGINGVSSAGGGGGGGSVGVISIVTSGADMILGELSPPPM